MVGEDADVEDDGEDDNKEGVELMELTLTMTHVMKTICLLTNLRLTPMPIMKMNPPLETMFMTKQKEPMRGI